MQCEQINKPEADIELIVNSNGELLEGLREGTLDIVVTSTQANADLYRADELYYETYKVVISSEHALSSKESVPLTALANTPMLDRPNCEMRDTLYQICSDSGYELYAAYRSNRVNLPYYSIVSFSCTFENPVFFDYIHDFNRKKPALFGFFYKLL
ncbi:LysR family transcriptional regulator substrate-binding protein [Glaciecola siphonariae]|uniref:LysR family transcriptional regulator substrate-binding protein n=1 Tax=Glaciecola siphonariae TaxID=521012 RepID=A0ABV9LTL7_9ALTE